MVYESGFTTRRSYSTRPVTTSYSVTYPTVQRYSRVYKTSYPIYSSAPKRIFSGSTRIITSPIRVISSPARVISTRIVRSPSPVRVVRTTTRVISSPERTTTYSYSSPSTIYSTSYVPTSYYSYYTPSSYVYTTPSYVYSPISRVYTRSLSPVRITASPVRVTPSYLKRIPAGYGARALTNYLGTEPYTTFKEETNRIRHRAQSLIRDVHTPVVRRARSATPFPVIGYGPTSKLALDAYVARVTDPMRHVAKEVHNIYSYPEPARKYVGKSHLASVRICGDKAYNIRKPFYQTDSEKVRTDINLLSWYLRHPQGLKEKHIDDNISSHKVEAVQVEA